MEYYHDRNISHRDIKLDNILVDPSNNTYDTKVIDFGFATQTQTKGEKLKTICGTPAFMAPELCLKKEYDGALVDIWAAGVVLFTILIG